MTIQQRCDSFRFSTVKAGIHFVLILLLSVSASRLQAQSDSIHARLSKLSELQRDLSDILRDPAENNANWGVDIISLTTGETLFEENASKCFLPASNLKLFTAAGALTALSPTFHFTTDLITNGKMDGNVLHGDLIIRGSGDPSLGSSSIFPDSSAISVFERWADTLVRKGVTKIDGSIIGDDSYFTDEPYPMGWSIEDLPYSYSMQTSGLSFAENQILVSVSPGKSSGKPARWELNPSTDYVTVQNDAQTKMDSLRRRIHGIDSVIPGSTTVHITRDMAANSITISGQIPQSAAPAQEQISVESPALYAATVFREVLDARGLQITGTTETSRELESPIQYVNTTTISTYTSPPLETIVRVMDKESDNMIAEQLFRTVAKEMTGIGSWAHATQWQKKFLLSLGMDTTKLALADGSGLSRLDLITPNQMVMLLRAMTLKKSVYGAFYNSLPIMGVDGTLSSRLKNTRAQGNIHAKTGFLTGARCVSGYLTTMDGEEVAFSIMANNFTSPVRNINNLEDLIMLRLVNFSRQ